VHCADYSDTYIVSKYKVSIYIGVAYGKIKNIIKFINDDSKLKSIFYNKTKNCKYKPRQLLEYVLNILKSGISYRMRSKMTNIITCKYVSRRIIKI
jgi:hypothetical protein